MSGSRGFAHERGGAGDSDEWYTPPHVFDALGLEFDLDPCSPPGGLDWVPARRFVALPDDGLSEPWEGRVWVNPPYGPHTREWLRRLAAHGDGVALVFARTETRWWHEVVPSASAVCFVEGRLRFVPGHREQRPGGGANAAAPSALIAFGEPCAEAVAGCGLGMVFRCARRELGGQPSLWEALP